MAIKKTSKFCYVVNRVHRIWPTYATTLGTGQQREVRRRGKMIRVTRHYQHRWAKLCYTFQNFDSSAHILAYVGQILLHFLDIKQDQWKCSGNTRFVPNYHFKFVV